MGEKLRLLVLTDFIKKEYLKSIGNQEKDVEALGVIPFFEMLRRQSNPGLKLGVLCGSVVIIPKEAKTELEQAIADAGTVTYSEFSSPEDVLLFASCLKPYIGETEPVYTRTPEGRQLLLEGRIYAFANRQERCLTKKKVKSALE